MQVRDFSHTFSYIIPYRHSIERLILLKRVLDYLKGFNGIEVLIIEDGTISHLSDMNLGEVKYEFVYNEGSFSRSYLFNVGAKYATTNYLCFGDSDIIMDPELLISSIGKLKEYDCVSPYSRVIDMFPNEFDLPYPEIFKIERDGRGEKDNQAINICGGVVLYTLEAFEKIGGFPEEFKGWGCEDNAMFIKTNSFLKWFETKGNCYHLFHSKAEINQEEYARNLQILNKIASMNKEQLSKWINMSKSKIAIKNKCW